VKPPLAPRHGQRPDRLERLLPLVLRVEMLEGVARAGQAEQVAKERENPLADQAATRSDPIQGNLREA
jgi:hypothetical protein